MQVLYVALPHPTYILLIIIALAALGYVTFIRPYIRAQRLDASLLRIADAFPTLRTCFEQSALLSSALLLEEADTVVGAGTGVVHELAPSVPVSSGGSPEDLRNAMQKALAANLKGLSMGALDGVLNAIEKETCGSVLEFWRLAAQHWRENPQAALESVMHVAKVAAEGSIVNIDGLLQHFAAVGEALSKHAASEISEKLHWAAAAGAGEPSSVGHALPEGSGPHHDTIPDLHNEINADPHFAGPDPDGIDVAGVDPDIDGLSSSLFDGIDPTMLLDGIPLITIVKSAFREIRLLSLDKTTAADALKNLVIDVGARAAGIGIGAAIGTAILPGIGTIIGGLLGGLFSGMAVNEVKAIPCKEAVEAYHTAYGIYQSEFASSIETWYGAFEKATNDSRKEFIARFSSFTPAGRRPEANQITMRLMDAVTGDYSNVANEIRAACSSSKLISQDRWFHLLGGVAIEGSLRVRAKALADVRIEQMEQGVRNMRAVQGNSARLRFVASLPCSTQANIKASFAAACEKVDELVKRVFAEFQIWISAARISQAKAFKETADVIAKQRKRHQDLASVWESRLKAKAAEAKRECEKLGG